PPPKAAAGTDVAPNATTPGPTAGPVRTPIERPPTMLRPEPGGMLPNPEPGEPGLGTQATWISLETSTGTRLGTARTALRFPSAHAARLMTASDFDCRAWTSFGTTFASFVFASSAIVVVRTSSSDSASSRDTRAPDASGPGMPDSARAPSLRS